MASRSPAVPGQQDKKVFNKNKKENDQWEHTCGIKGGQTILHSLESDFPELQDRNISNYLLLLYSTGLIDLKKNELWEYACGIKKRIDDPG